jgi:hypothetical protein
MIRITFTEEQLKQLHRWRFHHPHPRVQLKMDALLMKSEGLGVATATRASPTSEV